MENESYFKSFGEYSYVKVGVLRKRDEAAHYLAKLESITNDCEFNKLRKKYFESNFKSIVKDIYLKIEPYMAKIKKKDDYTKVKHLEDPKKNKDLKFKDFREIFRLLNKAIYVLGISDINTNDGDPTNLFGGGKQ